MRALLGWPCPLPVEEERARLLREVGSGLLVHFGGSAAALVAAADCSAGRLVELVTAHFLFLIPTVRRPRIERGDNLGSTVYEQ